MVTTIMCQEKMKYTGMSRTIKRLRNHRFDIALFNAISKNKSVVVEDIEFSFVENDQSNIDVKVVIKVLNVGNFDTTKLLDNEENKISYLCKTDISEIWAKCTSSEYNFTPSEYYFREYFQKLKTRIVRECFGGVVNMSELVDFQMILYNLLHLPIRMMSKEILVIYDENDEVVKLFANNYHDYEEIDFQSLLSSICKGKFEVRDRDSVHSIILSIIAKSCSDESEMDKINF